MSANIVIDCILQFVKSMSSFLKNWDSKTVLNLGNLNLIIAEALYKTYITYLRYPLVPSKGILKSQYLDYKEYYAIPIQGQPSLPVNYGATVYKLQSLAKEVCDYNILTQIIGNYETVGH